MIGALRKAVAHAIAVIISDVRDELAALADDPQPDPPAEISQPFADTTLAYQSEPNELRLGFHVPPDDTP